MRIIAGNAKGTKLMMVPGTHVRPTADRIKESLFNVLGPFFSGGKALDLFAGTGNLGLEALSRGMNEVVFVDSSAKSIHTIKQNAKKTRLMDQAHIWKKDARKAIADCREYGWQFDLIFVDPPYHKNFYLPILSHLVKYEILSQDGILVAEHAKDVDIPDTVGNLRTWRDLKYGETEIKLYRFD